MKHRFSAYLLIFVALSLAARGADENAARAGRLIEERPTLQCLGVRWYIAGDANHNARVEVRYRAAGEQEWRRAQDLFRTQGNWKADKAPAPGETLYAGSVFDLKEGAAYELKLNLIDPDGGAVEKTLSMRTRPEPRFEKPLRTLHVVPGTGGGEGSAANPFQGLEAAQKTARPGDLFLIHKGVYPATWEMRKSGTEGAPIIWRGAGDGEAAIDGGAAIPARGLSASGLHDVWLEGLSVRNVHYGIVAHDAARLVVRRCRIERVDYGFTATRYTKEKPCLDLYIADNELRGPSFWPRSKGIEDARGVQVTGLGHVVCYNHVRGFADAIDTFDSAECSAIDIYGNEVETLTDDGFECDYGQHNVRCFRNRLTNVFQGISTQPVFGGPIYIFRNVILNVGMETFKMHNDPSGALYFHNTSVKTGMPLILSTGASVENFVTRNNIFIGGKAAYAYETSAKMRGCDFDYDGFGGEWEMFLKWNRQRYRTMAEARDKAPVYRHAVRLDPVKIFAKGDARPDKLETELKREANDLRLAPGGAAVDAGAVLDNINDGFKGQAPDLGAYELGEDLPHYGPREK